MPCKACCLQNAGAMLPSLLEHAVVLQETSEQCIGSTIHHAVPGMLPAVHGRLVPGNDARSFLAKVM